MRRTVALALLLCGAAALSSAAEKPKGHASAVSGAVVRIDDAAKTFVVRAAGRDTTLVRTGATKVNGEVLRVGDRVAVRFLERDGRKVATSVRIEPPVVASVTPTSVAPSASR